MDWLPLQCQGGRLLHKPLRVSRAIVTKDNAGGANHPFVMTEGFDVRMVTSRQARMVSDCRTSLVSAKADYMWPILGPYIGFCIS